MKVFSYLTIVGIIFGSFFGSSAMAQCKPFVKTSDFSVMEDFDYCGGIMTAEMYRGDSAEVSIKMDARKKYRIMISAQDYLGSPQLDFNEAIITHRSSKEGAHYWDIFPEHKTKLELKISFQKTEKIGYGVNASGCVLLVIGEMGLEELVDNP